MAHINHVSNIRVTDKDSGIQYIIPEHDVNIEILHRECPNWGSIDYSYSKGIAGSNHDMYMYMSVDYPKRVGLTTYYLARGVMTYTWGGTDRERLERSWAQDVDDVLKHQPHGFWWFGAGSKGPGAHTSLPLLTDLGYEDDVAARRALLKITERLRQVVIT